MTSERETRSEVTAKKRGQREATMNSERGIRNESAAKPNHALQRTPGFAVQLPGAAVVRPAQSRAVLPAMKPGTARAFALRRWLTAPAPGPESLSLGSLGVATRIPRNIHAVNNHQIRRTK